MSYPMLRRSLVLLVLILVMSALSVPSARAADLGWQQLAGGLSQAVSTWLDSLAPRGFHRVGTVQAKSRCSIDPLGNRICQPDTPNSSCSIDPQGNHGCQPVTPKDRCSIDPQGNTRCAP
jgi:hypothetical protein